MLNLGNQMKRIAHVSDVQKNTMTTSSVAKAVLVKVTRVSFIRHCNYYLILHHIRLYYTIRPPHQSAVHRNMIAMTALCTLFTVASRINVACIVIMCEPFLVIEASKISFVTLAIIKE